MNDQATTQDLKERLELIESMLAAGRRKTENWGWTFVLWGAAYYVAIAWANWGRSRLAWPVTMIGAAVITAIVAATRKTRDPETTVGTAIGSIWIAFGLSIFLLMFSLTISHRLNAQLSISIMCAMLGMANATSGMIVKWKMQLACALVWWTAAVAACFGDENQGMIVLLVAILFCQIGFGIYAMICGSKRRHGAIHA
jgi:hypothetical protein